MAAPNNMRAVLLHQTTRLLKKAGAERLLLVEGCLSALEANLRQSTLPHRRDLAIADWLLSG